jgi:small subunit ribosomal protein S6
MALYESVFIARQDISSAQAEALTEQFAQIIGDNGGTVSKKEYWGLKSLAFRIKKNRKGHYVLLNIDAPPAAVIEMERNMRINEDVIRYLTVKVDQLEEGPSAILQGRDRGERGDRDRDRDRPRYRDDDRPPREDRAPREGAPE